MKISVAGFDFGDDDGDYSYIPVKTTVVVSRDGSISFSKDPFYAAAPLGCVHLLVEDVQVYSLYNAIVCEMADADRVIATATAMGVAYVDLEALKSWKDVHITPPSLDGW